MNVFTKYIRGVKGTAPIEFALILPVFLVLIGGCMELGYVFWANSALKYGATYGARYAFSHPTASATTVKNYALSTIDFPGSAITYTATTTGDSTDINGSFSYSFLLVPISPITLTVHVHQVLPSS